MGTVYIFCFLLYQALITLHTFENPPPRDACLLHGRPQPQLGSIIIICLFRYNAYRYKHPKYKGHTHTQETTEGLALHRANPSDFNGPSGLQSVSVQPRVLNQRCGIKLLNDLLRKRGKNKFDLKRFFFLLNDSGMEVVEVEAAAVAMATALGKPKILVGRLPTACPACRDRPTSRRWLTTG